MAFSVFNANKKCGLAAWEVFYLPWHRSPRARTRSLVIFEVSHSQAMMEKNQRPLSQLIISMLPWDIS